MGVEDTHGLWASVVFVGLGAVLWLVPLGFIVDHVFRQRGWAITLGAHVVGAFFGYIVSQIILAPDYIVSGPPVGPPFSTLGIFAIPIGTMIAFLFAGFVPGSFPERRVAPADAATSNGVAAQVNVP